MTDKDRLDALAKAESEAYRRRQAMAFFDCAVNLLATDYDIDEVEALLRMRADEIRDFG